MNPLSSVLDSLPAVCRNLVAVGLGILLQTTLLLAVGLVLGRALARRGPALQAGVYRAALISAIASLPLFLCLLAVLPPSWRVSLPAVRESPSVQSRDVAPASPAIRPPSAPPLPSGKPSAAPPARITVSPPAVEPTPAPTAPVSPLATPFTDFLKPTADGPMTAWGWLYAGIAAFYLCGLAGHVLWLLVCWNGVRRLVRQSRTVTDSRESALLSEICAAAGVSAPRLRSHPAASGVFLVGAFRPTVLLPDGWADAKEADLIRAVLTHEVAHLSGRDPLWNLIFRSFCALLWFQPLLWLLLARWETAREEVCDLAVVRGGTAPRFYARCLLELAAEFTGAQRPPVATSAMLRGSSLGRRIERLMLPPARITLTLSRRAQASIALAGVCLTVAAAAFGAVSAPGQEPKSQTDTRLEQQVTVSAEGISLEEFLPLLSQKTGISFTASRSTADDKIVLFCKSRPLRDVMDDIAALFNYEWRAQNPGSKPDYVLIVTARARRYEDKLAGAQRERFLNALDAQVRALTETPEQLAARPEDDPIRKTLSDPKARIATSLYALLSPQQREELYDRWSVSLPVRLLSSEQRTQVSELFYGENFKRDPASGLTPTEIPAGEMQNHALSFGLLLLQEGERGSQLVTMTAPTGMGFSLAALPAESAFTLPPHGNPYTGEPVAESSVLPDAKVVAAISEKEWVDSLRQLAEKTGVPVAADYYRSAPVHTAPDAPTNPADSPAASGALDAFCRPTGYLWWARGSALLFRKRDWYEQRQYEVPDRWTLSVIKQLAAQKGVLTLADILRMRELSLSQLVGINQSLGGKQSRFNLAGFQELLNIVSLCAQSGGRILTETDKISPGNAVVRNAAYRPNTADISQRELLSRFLMNFRLTQMFKDQNWDDFGFLFQRAPLDSLKPFSIKSGAGFHVFLHLGNSLGVGYFGLALPVTLPDDRRDRTRIDVTPAS